MLATGNKYMQEAANTIFELNADELIRKQCRDREEYYQDLRNYERVIAQKDTAIMKKDATIADLQQSVLEVERLRALLKEHGIDDPQ